MKAYAKTDIGSKRSMNQDYMYCNTEPVGSFQNLLIVADGMGGHRAGAVSYTHLTLPTTSRG